MPWTKIRFFSWLSIVGFFIISFCFLLLTNGLQINTNLLSLLPKGEQSQLIEHTKEQVNRTLGNEVIFLIGNSNKDQANLAAKKFTSYLQQSDMFSHVQLQISNETQMAWAKLYFSHRFNFLTKTDKQYLLNNDSSTLVSQALANLYSPIGIASGDLIKNDPFASFQNYITSIKKPASQLELVDGVLLSKYQSRYYIFVKATLKGESFSLRNQQSLINVSGQAQNTIKQQFNNTTFLQTGMIFYAQAGAQAAKSDVSTIGIGSIIGIIVLTLIVFRSLSPLAMTLLSASIGFICAYVITCLVFGSVFLLTLVFGASLIGICVDYAFFYFSDRLVYGQHWQAEKGLKRIFPGITLGLINLIAAYLIIAIAPFSGLQQIATFAISGLIMSYFTVIALFPMVLKAKNHQHNSWVSNYAKYYLKLWQKRSKTLIFVVFTLLGFVVVISLFFLRFNDDIRILQHLPPALVAQQHKIKEIIGSNTGTNYLIVQANTQDQLLMEEQKITALLKENFKASKASTISLNNYLIPTDEQKQNFNLIQNQLLKPHLKAYLQKIGVNHTESQQIYQRLSHLTFQPLTINDWLNSPASKDLRFLYQGKIQSQYVGIMLLADGIDITKLKTLITNNKQITLVDPANDLSYLFAKYRVILSYLLFFAFLGFAFLILLRYGIKRLPYLILPPLIAIGLALTANALFAIPITIFTIFAIILVLGIAADYVLFFAESTKNHQSTMLATLLSAMTTILSFGLLYFSSTPAVSYFGITVFVGILCAFLLAPLAANRQRKDITSDALKKGL